MATPKIVPREQGEGQIGSSAKGWGEAHVTNTTTSSSSQGGKLVLSSDDGAVQGNDHRLGVIEFKGAEDTSGTLSLGASIESFADLAFTASENAGKLVFNTVDGTTASPVLTLDKDKKATLTGALEIKGDSCITGDAAAAVWVLRTSSNDAATHPTRLAFQRQCTAADNLDLGEITFSNGPSNTHVYARILGEIADATPGEEAGRLSLFVTEYDGTGGSATTPGLVLNGDTDADGEVDVTIAAGAGSTTTVAGDLTVTGDVVMVANLPTSDPSNAGQLWNDSNTIKVSAG